LQRCAELAEVCREEWRAPGIGACRVEVID
jgi:hypothetical protein